MLQLGSRAYVSPYRPSAFRRNGSHGSLVTSPFASIGLGTRFKPSPRRRFRLLLWLLLLTVLVLALTLVQFDKRHGEMREAGEGGFESFAKA